MNKVCETPPLIEIHIACDGFLNVFQNSCKYLQTAMQFC